MFYNLHSIYRNLFVFTVSKISYDLIYRSKDSGSKIITLLMCLFGSQFVWNNIPKLTYKNQDIPLIADIESDDERMEELNQRSNISDVLNDVDRLLDNSKMLGGENIDQHIV